MCGGAGGERGSALRSRRRRGLARARGEGGFTLLELIVVLVIAALAAAVVAPSFSGTLESARLRAGAAELRATLAFARTLSASQSRPRTVAVDPSSGAYGVVGEAGRRLPEGIRVESIRVGEPAPAAPLSGDAAPAKIRFFPDGTAEESEVVLSSPGGGRLRVLVDPLTGLAEART